MAGKGIDFGGDRFIFATERVASAISYARRLGKTREWRDADPLGAGLTLRVGARSATFTARCRVDGKMAAIRLGHADGEGRLSVTQARAALARVKGGDAPAPKAAQAAEDTTPLISDVADAYLAAHASGEWLPQGRSKKPTADTMEDYAQRRRACMAGYEGLTLAQFAEHLHDIHGEVHRRAPVQADRFRQLVRNIFNFAGDRGMWDGPNPATDTRAIRFPRSGVTPRQRTLSDEEIKQHLFCKSVFSEEGHLASMFR